MAIYHLRMKTISRSKGQSALKSAAYRHGVRLYDERLQKAFRYRKPDVVHSEIIAPTGAPEWVFRRSELWNRVELAENRSDAQTAREVEITLPRELTPEQRVELVRGFITEHFVARGMVADIAIHVPTGADGLEQPHAHVMLTMRPLDDSTRSGFSRLKERGWNEDPTIEAALREAKDAFRREETPENAARIEALDKKRNVNVWRAAWADHANAALADAGAPARIDHRTLEAQGLKRLAEPYLGLARHIEKAYVVMKDRVANWLAVVKRNELYRNFEPYLHRDPGKFTQDIAAIADFTTKLMNHWKERPRDERPAWENGHDR